MEILGHFTTNVHRALSEIDKDYLSYDGLVVCGSHSPTELPIEGMIEKIRAAWLSGKPYLGICFGHQLAAIEYARNVMGMPDATSEEFGEGTFVVVKRDTFKVGLHDGETFWSNYTVTPELELKWKKPDYFITVPYHPEYESSKDNPHPVLTKFIRLAKQTL